MAPRYLTPSERASVRWLAAEITRWRRPSRARRVRTFVLQTPPRVPSPRRPVDIAVLHRVLDGLRNIPGAI